MKTKLFPVLTCLIMGMSTPSLLAADKAAPKDTTVVIARGLGLNAEKALLAALRNAVQQVVGVIVDAETLIKNEKVVKDEILDFSNGFVEKFEKLKEGKNEDGLYEVTIRATVKHRQLIEKLKQAKVHSVKVDGQSLFGATASKMEAAGKGAALLKKGLEDLNLPMSLVTARVINQKPKVIAENDDTIQGEWIIRIGYDQKKYFEKVVPRLKQLLGEVATAKIQEPLVKQEKWFFYSDQKIAAKRNWGNGRNWAGKEFWDGIQIVPYIALSYLLYGIFVLQMPSIYLKNKQNWMPILWGAGLLVNFLGNIVLIPYYSYFGAAISTLLSYITMLCMLVYKNRIWLPIYYRAQRIFCFGGVSALFFVINYFLIRLGI